MRVGCTQLMLDASGERVMITDFGFAKNFWESTPKTCLGTAAYVAPEVLELKPYDGTKVDAWACGVILYAMLEGDYPFGVGGGKGVGRKGDKQLHERLRRGWAAVEFPRHFQRGAIALLKRLLTADPAVRVSCQEALMDEWFQGDAAVASAVASDLRKLRGQSPPSARKSEGSFGALDSPLKINRLFTQQPPEPEPEPGAVVVVAAADQKTVLEESDATIRAADAAAEVRLKTRYSFSDQCCLYEDRVGYHPKACIRQLLTHKALALDSNGDAGRLQLLSVATCHPAVTMCQSQSHYPSELTPEAADRASSPQRCGLALGRASRSEARWTRSTSTVGRSRHQLWSHCKKRTLWTSRARAGSAYAAQPTPPGVSACASGWCSAKWAKASTLQMHPPTGFSSLHHIHPSAAFAPGEDDTLCRFCFFMTGSSWSPPTPAGFLVSLRKWHSIESSA